LSLLLMRPSLLHGIAVLVGSVIAVVAPDTHAAEPDDYFATRVWPLLDSRCVQCHGPKKQKGALRLDSREAALHGGDSGPALVPGKPKESLLLRLVRHAEKDLEMPPKEKLAEAEIAVFERWIADGARWTTPRISAAAIETSRGERIGDAWHDPRNPIVRIFNGERLDLWSLKPIAKTAPPAVRDSAWVRNPIDEFVLAKLEATGVAPAPEADRRTLARRVAFDLTGLPPSFEAVEAFVASKAQDAYEKFVDRLLASPAYGEHQARMWLDVVRYSDSNGFDWDEFRPVAWRFRDYVIRAFNADKPFDRFVREQLAGDEMFDGAPRNLAEQDCLIATGFLRLGPHDNSAAQFGEADRVRNQWMTDLVETTSAGFLGLTMSCCRCHDHKFDPLSQADHYRLRAFFEPAKHRDDLPIDLADKQEAIRCHNATIDAALAEARAERAQVIGPVQKRLREERLAQLSPDERALLETSRDQRPGGMKAKIKDLEKRIDVPEKEIQAALDEKEKAAVAGIDRRIETKKKERQPFTTALLATDDDAAPKPTRVLFQGDLHEPRDTVAPGILSALDPNPATIRNPRRYKSSGRRTALADWLVSTENPLTSRVFVNRIWQMHFGEGLVATPNDFGLAGAGPTHPALLDWLARAFMDRGWSSKELHRLIVTSATYRQSSAGDADAKLLARQRVRRLTGEALRDAMLAVAGRLQPSNGGPPVWPELPAEVLRANPAFLDDNAEKTKGWYPSPPENADVRSIYLVQKRTVHVPLLEVFDLPENAVSCARRNVSTVAPQALTLLNSPFAVEMAAAFAKRVEAEAGKSAEEQVDFAFRQALARRPAAGELAACVQLLQRRSLAELCRVLLNVNEFVYVD
jgi:hypothetical protein